MLMESTGLNTKTFQAIESTGRADVPRVKLQLPSTPLTPP